LSRQHLIKLLYHYVDLYPDELEKVEKFRIFIEKYPDCFERTCLPAHITGSAWIVSPDHRKYLMTKHRIFNRWLQLGGHSDGCCEPHLVALREAREESGLTRFGLYCDPAGFVPLDIDIHTIGARGNIPSHKHYDIRYLMIATIEEPLKIGDESHDLGWFDKSSLENICQEKSILRMLIKGANILTYQEGSVIYDL